MNPIVNMAWLKKPACGMFHTNKVNDGYLQVCFPKWMHMKTPLTITSQTCFGLERQPQMC